MAKLRYLGHKTTKADPVANSGVIWHGHGDVREVRDDQAKILLQHPDVWKRVDEESAQAEPVRVTTPPPQPTIRRPKRGQE